MAHKSSRQSEYCQQANESANFTCLQKAARLVPTLFVALPLYVLVAKSGILYTLGWYFMNHSENHKEIITNVSVREYVFDTVTTAVANQKQSFSAETLFYITNLLTQFSRSEQLYEIVDDGYDVKPLALIYADAINAESNNQRLCTLKYLGDVALFISGLFAASLNRSLVGIDYYIGMGESAYGSLAGDAGMARKIVFQLIYDELSHKFVSVVEVLNEVRDQMNAGSDEDLIRLYENWLRTDSDYAAEKLRKHGIQPVATASKIMH